MAVCIARNAVAVVLAGAVYAVFLVNGRQPFTASNHIPAGLPPFQAPQLSLVLPDDNRTVTTTEIFSVRLRSYENLYSPQTVEMTNNKQK